MPANTRLYGMTCSQSVTPNDTVNDSTAITNGKAPGDPNPAGFIVGVSGDVAVQYANGEQDTLPAMAAGIVHACQFTHILATGTTATTIKAVFQ